MKNKLKNQLGISTLVLVFIVASLMALIISALILVTFLSATRSAQTLHTQKVFFAAEGALYATIQRLKDDPDWTPPPGGYQIDGITIETELDESDGGVNILVTATLKGTKRTLAGTYGVGEAGRTPLDIILVIDHSQSMKDGGCKIKEVDFPGHGKITKEVCEPLVSAQIAALDFLTRLDNTIDQVGVVGYAASVNPDEDLIDLTFTYQDVREKIIGFTANDATNIARAIREAMVELDEHGREEAKKVTIVLSDGVANRSVTPCPCQPPPGDRTYCCGGYPCVNLDPSNFFQPFDDPFNPPEFPPDPANPYVGTCCTDDAVGRADTAKENPRKYIFFSIFLNKIRTSDCNCSDSVRCPFTCSGACIPSTQELGRKTLQQIANGLNFYYETAEEGDLEAIYNAIAEFITSPGFFEIWEEVPEPD